MSIANEISSEIAAAMLSRQGDEDSERRSDLKDVLIKAHSTLRRMTTEARKAGRRAKDPAPSPKGSAASGAN
jgi:hypothetical protein